MVAVAGAGGKTTLVRRLAAEAHAAGLRVLLTTTTHMGMAEAWGPVFVESEGDVRDALATALRKERRATLLGRQVRPDKVEGVSPERVDALAGEVDLVLVEADGARGRSLKMPAPHEPVVPASTTLLLVVAALDVLGHPIGPERVHRLDLMLAATGRAPGEPLDEAAVGLALGDPAGYPARRPAGGRIGLFLNKVEDARMEAAAARIAAGLVPPYAFVAAGSARDGMARLWP